MSELRLTGEASKMLLSSRLAATAELRWWLAEFGSLVEVSEPESLWESASKLAGNYEIEQDRH